ncbi:EAL domain-containing protein [Algiphilus aromaticivorans]|uniref:EAL domain-containing protein n=1 Tax=Algiphilus aromaticivorans TaxID=382454 RepID=UPI000694CCDD|nr:EAL domain-containing protein [Algiphilus aromaticivorans]
MKPLVDASSAESLDAVVDGIMRAAVDAVIVVDAQQRIHAVSETAARWLDSDNASLCGEALPAVLRFVEASRLAAGAPVSDALVVEPVRWAIERGWRGESMDHLCAVFSGRALPVRARFAALAAPDGTVCGAVCAMSDLSAAAEAARALDFARDHDPVTGLPNREHFERSVTVCELDGTPPNRPYWVAYADVDRFRLINDAAGHIAGDALLRAVAGTMRGVLRSGDQLARIGGDEFGIFIQPCSRREAGVLLQRLSDAAGGLQFSWQGRDLPSTITIGAAPLSSTSRDVQSVMRLAERARFEAKESGRGQVAFANESYAAGQHDAEVASVSRVLSALDDGRFLLHSQDVQPVSGEPRAVYRELLVRMRDDDGRMVPPGDFIPGAERYFLMDAIDRWVVDAALKAIESMPDDGVLHAVNLSGQSLSNPSFRDWLIERLEARSCLRRRLCFEVTETAAVRQLGVARIFFEQLSRMGVQLALDDFGVGMSSFGYLSSLPVRYLKIDGSFVRDIADNAFNAEVVRAIADVARAAGMVCIAEHVEDRAMLPQLAGLGVHLAQGWGVAREVEFPARSAGEVAAPGLATG